MVTGTGGWGGRVEPTEVSDAACDLALAELGAEKHIVLKALKQKRPDAELSGGSMQRRRQQQRRHSHSCPSFSVSRCGAALKLILVTFPLGEIQIFVTLIWLSCFAFFFNFGGRGPNKSLRSLSFAFSFSAEKQSEKSAHRGDLAGLW